MGLRTGARHMRLLVIATASSIALLSAAGTASAAPGDITTVAGAGTAGFFGDNGAATAAQLKQPNGIAPTPDGGFLIADSSNNRIRKVLNGVITTVAGTGAFGFSGDDGTATAAQLGGPSSVAPTPDGGYLIADTYNSRIRKVLNGVITTVAGTGTGGFSGDNGAATAAKLSFPTGVAPTPDGGFLIADASNDRIRKVLNGTITTVAGDGTAGSAGDGGAAPLAQLNFPSSVAPTPDGGFLIADFFNQRIRKVLNGVITTVAGAGTEGFFGDGGAATAAQLNRPTGVAPTADGGFLISDQGNNRVRKVLNGVITTVAGSGTAGFSGDNGAATAAELNVPHGVAPTPDGGFLIADTNNHRIRKVEGVPTPTVLNTNPPSPANQNTVSVTGLAPAAATVNLYTSADCNGTPLASGTGAQFGSPGIPVSVADNSTTTFYAQATQNGFTSACSTTSVTFVEQTPAARDLTPPNTKLKKVTINSKARKATFTFTSTEKGSTFKCRLDKRKFSKCRSPRTYKHLKPGKHTFYVRATDKAGNVDKTPVKKVFRIKPPSRH